MYFSLSYPGLSSWQRSGIAAALTVAVCFINRLMVDRLGEGLLILPVGTVLLTTLICGAWLGFASILLNALGLAWLVLDPPGSPRLLWPDGYMHETAYLLVSGLAWWAAVGLRRETIKVSERDQAMATAAHDLRSPLNVLSLTLTRLQGATESISDEDRKSELDKAIAGAERQIAKMDGLIEALFTICRARGNPGEQFDLSLLVREVIDEIRPEIVRSGCHIKLQTQPVIGHWHRLGLKRVVTNLVGNATKYASGTTLTVKVGLVSGRAQLEVSDGGPGIPPSIMSRIFAPYKRGSTMGRYLDGSGLGIYIVREIVRAHGGTVEVYSAPGQGARFVIRLPLLQAGSRWLRLKAVLGFSHRATDPTPPTTVGFQA